MPGAVESNSVVEKSWLLPIYFTKSDLVFHANNQNGRVKLSCPLVFHVFIAVVVVVYLMAVTVSGRHGCGRHGLWLSWYRPSRHVLIDDTVCVADRLVYS